MGGHIRSRHPRMSKTYRQRQIIFQKRARDRKCHTVARDLYEKIKVDGLDPRDEKTFKQQKNQMSRVEKWRKALQEMELTANHDRYMELDPRLHVTPEQIHNSDKSKIRCIKQKIYDQLKLSESERRKNMTEYWAKRLDEIMRVPVFE